MVTSLVFGRLGCMHVGHERGIRHVVRRGPPFGASLLRAAEMMVVTSVGVGFVPGLAFV